MKIGLIIYGRLDTLSGGYLYDRKLVEHLEAAGDEVEIVSLPWEGYGRSLLHNFWFALAEQLRLADFDLLLQDELNHPSLFWLNRRLRGRDALPLLGDETDHAAKQAAPLGHRRRDRVDEAVAVVVRRALKTLESAAGVGAAEGVAAGASRQAQHEQARSQRASQVHSGRAHGLFNDRCQATVQSPPRSLLRRPPQGYTWKPCRRCPSRRCR